MSPLWILPALLAAASARQDPPQPPALPGESAPPAMIASDGEPAAPGRVPDGTSDEALGRWRRVLEAVGGGSLAGRPRVGSFDLALDVTHYHPSGSNDTQAGIRYLETAGGPYLRSFLERRDLVLLRGPSGDFLIDGEEPTALVGRDFAEDLRQLDEYTAICRNFLSLTRPDQVRLVRLEALGATARAGRQIVLEGERKSLLQLPDEQATEEALALEWLLVESPDFRLVAGEDAGGAHRAVLGLDPGTGEVRFALLAEPGSGPLVDRTSLLVSVHPYRDIDGGWRVPRALEVRQVPADVLRPAFPARERLELWLKRESRLNPELTLRDFLPPG